MLYLLLGVILGLLVLKKLFVRSILPNQPPGPKFRVPILGQIPFMLKNKDVLKSIDDLRKKYGDIFSYDHGTTMAVVISDYNIIREVLEDHNFDFRPPLPGVMKGALQEIRGGNGQNGLISSSGQEWKQQRRFALHTFKDFGFAKSFMDEAIVEEALELCDDLKERANENDELQLDSKINLAVLNVLWRIVVGKRHDLNNPDQQSTLKRLSNFSGMFGPGNISMMLSFLMPKFIRNKMKAFLLIKDEHNFFHSIALDHFKEHEETFDEDNMRDYIDCYIRERRRVERDGDTKSSFFGDYGMVTFQNTFFDFLLAGSETISNTLLFAVIFLVNHPQVKAQAELERVVGKSRPLSMADKPDLPYLNALICEIQRCGNIVPMAVDHSNIKATKIRGYDIPKGTMVVPNLTGVLWDQKNFENPMEFKPERFIDSSTGEFISDPKVIPFGIGGRYCPGKNLAVRELFLFIGIFLQQFTFKPASGGPPDPDNVTIGIVRHPNPFYVKVEPRY